MKRISEIEELFDTLDQAEESRIIDQAMEKINASRGNAKRRRKVVSGKRLFAAVLAATMLLTFTVSAKEGSMEKIYQVIEKIFIKAPLAEQVGIEPVQDIGTVPVEDITEGDKIQAECEGVKVAVEQIISDGEDAYVYFSVAIPEELVPDEEGKAGTLLHFGDCKIQLGNEEPQTTFFRILKEDVNQRYGIVYFSMEELEAASYEAVLTLENLDYEVWKGNERETETRLVEGQWILKWNVQCEKIAESREFTETIETYNGVLTTEEVIISPFSIKIVGKIEYDDPSDSNHGCSVSKVILKDGTIRNLGRIMTGAGEGTYVMKGFFGGIIPVEDIAGVVIKDQYFYFEK